VVIEDLFFGSCGCPPKVHTKAKSVEAKKIEAKKDDKEKSKSVDKVEANKDAKKSSSGTKMKVIFKMNHTETRWGQTLNLVGSIESLGGWKSKKAKKMSSINTYPRWES